MTKAKKSLTKTAVYSLVGGLLGGVCGFIISQVLLTPFWIMLLLGGDQISSLTPIRWIIDHPSSFFIWYGILIIFGLILGVVLGYRFGVKK